MRRFFSNKLSSGGDTIYALATASGVAGVGIIRISGPKCTSIAGKIIASSARTESILANPRKLFRCNLVDENEQSIDKAMAVYFPKPNSFTGEDILELHIHSSRAIVSSVYKLLSKIEGTRCAGPGEFSRRAFANGKMDLAQIEGLGDLLVAETDSQRRMAIHQLEGHCSREFTKWRSTIIEAMAMTEAWIDFSEDENIEHDTLERVSQIIEKLVERIKMEIERQKCSEIVKSGIRIALCGAPNAGKSTLLNMLARRDASIVSPIAGTTRDVIQVNLNIDGIPCVIYDTAGIRETESAGERSAGVDEIEKEGIQRALKVAESADLILFLTETDNDCLISSFDPKKVVIVRNKIDLFTQRNENGKTSTCPVLFNSINENHHRQFQEGLRNILKERFANIIENSNEMLPVIVNERQKSLCASAVQSLESAQSTLQTDVVLAAEYLRMAANSIGKVTGNISHEDILDSLFSTFCIGK